MRYWIIGLMLWCGVVWAGEQAEFYDPSEIQSQVIRYLNQTVNSEDGRSLTFQTGKIDAHLKLARCNVPLTINVGSFNEVNKRALVKVSCQGLKTWTINVSAHAQYKEKVVVAARNISAGTVLSSEQLKVVAKKQETGRAVAFFSIQDVVGKVLKRSIGEGQVIYSSMIDNPLYVKRGQSVAILAEKDNLQVTMPGIALQDGQLNQEIEIKNKKSNKVIAGRVIGKNQVKIEF